MRKLYVRFAITMLLIVAASSGLATFLTFLLFLNSTLSEQDLFLAMRMRSFLIPLLTVLSSALVIALTSKRAVAPITALSGVAKQITQGNLEIDVQISKRKDEIGELERDFSLMLKELRSNEYLRKDFIANISHEFKTPLSVIEGYAQLLSEASVSESERLLYAQTIQNESERLRRLSSNILRLSRLETQAIQTGKTTFKLDEQIRQTVLYLEPKWNRRAISFDISLDELLYFGDEELLSLVWLNLIENAVKFSNDGGAIHIRMRATDIEVQIEIVDHGVGMDEETQVRAFEQFYQGETSHNTEGSGLGLAIVKRIVVLHGGDVVLDSMLGEGTKVIVRLPVLA